MEKLESEKPFFVLKKVQCCGSQVTHTVSLALPLILSCASTGSLSFSRLRLQDVLQLCYIMNGKAACLSLAAEEHWLSGLFKVIQGRV